MHRDGEIIGKGNSHANVEVVLPNERCFNLKMNRNVDIKKDVSQIFFAQFELVMPLTKT